MVMCDKSSYVILVISYLDIRGVSLAVFPRGRHGVKGAVGVIKLASLQVQEERREWLLKRTRGVDGDWWVWMVIGEGLC